MRIVGFLIFLIAVIGCTERPSAPALRDEPVYDNPREGLRFLKPQGWIQQAKSAAPAGPADVERMLVRYAGPPGVKPPTFEVSMQDLGESTDMAAFLAEPSHNIAAPWQLVGQPESLTMDGVAATRYAFTQQNMMKESVVVRRGKRFYFFTLLGTASDAQSREQIRSLIREVRWTR